MAYVTSINFKQFIALAYKGKTFRGTPVGDFIEDAFEDKNFKCFESLKGVEDYLSKRIGVCDGARIAARDTFKIWERTHGRVKHVKT